MTIPQAFELALAHHGAGQLAETETICRQILAVEPQHPDALHMLGIVAHQTGQNELAEQLIKQAIASAPHVANYHSNLGEVYRARNQLDEAAAAYRAAIALQPALPEAHNNLGLVLHGKGRMDESIAACQTAIALRPGYAEAHVNLGNALKEKGRLGDAIAAYRTALQFKPNLALAWNNLGMALKAAGKAEDALSALRNAIQCDPNDTLALTNLGNLLNDLNRREEAITAYQRALESAPDSVDLPHVLAAVSGNHCPTTSPADYVRKLFDGYASNFDAHLLGDLHYRVPEIFREVIAAAAPDRTFDILDLGCGTGLCAVQFRPMAKTLIGVDLSPAMIAKAEARGVYDQLINDDVVDAMRDQQSAFDLILAGDLFIYVGDVSGVFSAAARVLRGGGLFAFSLERYDGEGFALHSKARFAHSLGYIRNLSGEHHFAELHTREIIVRKEGPTDVTGWIVVLRKQDEAGA